MLQERQLSRVGQLEKQGALKGGGSVGNRLGPEAELAEGCRPRLTSTQALGPAAARPWELTVLLGTSPSKARSRPASGVQ